MIHSESVTSHTSFQLREPSVLGDAGVVMPPQIRPAQRRQRAEMFRAYERLARFVLPVGTRIPVADEQKRLL